MNVPPARNTHSASRNSAVIAPVSSTRRKFLGIFWGLSLAALSKKALWQEDIESTQESIRLRSNGVVNGYPETGDSNSRDQEFQPQKYGKSWTNETGVRNRDWSISVNSAEIQVIREYGTLISALCRDLDLDSAMMIRLVAHESKGKPNSVSLRWARWLMQIMPETAQNLVARYSMYQSYFQNISPSIVGLLRTPVAREAMKILTQPAMATSRKWAGAVNSMMYQMFNSEANLIFWHVYFAGLRSQVESKIDTYQQDVSRYFATLAPAQYQRIAISRKAMGIDAVTLEYLRWTYAERIRSDFQFARETESLIQYNGGGVRPKQSYNYAAIIQA